MNNDPVTRGAMLLAIALAGGAAVAAEPKLPELNLRYAVAWGGIQLGDAVITLKAEGGADCYRYESLTEPAGIVRMFYGRPREISEFCIKGGVVVPRKFTFRNPKDDDESFTLEFEPGKVKAGDGAVREVPANAQDRFGIQQAVRLWVLQHLTDEPGAQSVEFTMVDDRRVRAYRFAITGRETVSVPAGKFEAVVVQRIGSKKRSTRFWLGATRDYMPVKVEQLRDGKVELRLTLKNG